jgi:hypothetical protein
MTQLQSKINARIAAQSLARQRCNAYDYAGLPARAETRGTMTREGVLTLNYRQTFLDCLIGLHVDGLTPGIIHALYDGIARAPAPFMAACTENWGQTTQAVREPTGAGRTAGAGGGSSG